MTFEYYMTGQQTTEHDPVTKKHHMDVKRVPCKLRIVKYRCVHSEKSSQIKNIPLRHWEIIRHLDIN